MFGRHKNRAGKRLAERERGIVEVLESRTLLSAANLTIHSDAIFLHSATTSSSTIQGYIPSQIRHAYGFDQINLKGQGQTIAIVDAYNDPNIQSDLGTFDSEFGLSAPPSFNVVSQSGGKQLPVADSGWAGEISLDVEWAHAIAPQANILLVEANSASLSDLLSAVNYARNATSVSVVSMSWGGTEFFNWNGTEFTGQTQYDPTFTTPAGHQGVTFVAAAGDSGAGSGVQWPASSPNVLTVGGTSLYLQDQSGTYSSESSWSGTSGGYSQIEPEPSYQQGVQSSGVRSTPDVSYNADPNTGFAVYNSVADQGFSGWQVVGGTSAGAPQWAALVAIADQARVSAGRGTLDGASQTLPLLYSLYNSSGSSSYTSYFNDVVDNTAVDSGGNAPWRWQWGWGYGNPATKGYDIATGLGSPKAARVVDALSGASSSTSGSSGSSGNSGSSGSTTQTPQQLPASPISGTLITSPPGEVVGGDAGSLKLRLTNTGGTRFSGPISITLDASPDGSISSANTFVTTISLKRLNLRAGGSKTVNLKFHYPTGVTDGSDYLVATIDATGTNTAPAEAISATPVTIAAPSVDLAATFASSNSVLVNPGKGGNTTVTIQNLGNVTASGTLGLSLYASADQTLDAADQLLTTSPTRAIRIQRGHSIKLHIHFQAPTGESGGSYYLIASAASSTSPADGNPFNDTAVIGTRA